ncbi:AAA family ATPase [Patescibacteria group bacterium]|nr:AAA family ATPase [Patescibacteria group bacterium]
MFERHFHMTSLPFTEHITVDRIQQDDRFTQALSRLQYFSLQGSLAVITGNTGVGKSTLIKLFLNSLDRSYCGLYVHLTQVQSSCLLKLVSEQLGQTPKQTKEKVFKQILERVRNSDLKHLLVLDEAHLATVEALTDLRLLISSALDDTAPLKILLVGQQNLNKTLALTTLTDLYHRINIRYNLKPLSKTQTISYIDLHLKNAGADSSIFSNDVKNSIFKISHGIPRLINQVATTCLISAASRNLHKIDDLLFSKTIDEFHIF